MNLVIVESPAKAKTINKYLGKNYLVLASYGHIRDLPSKNGSVDPENKFQMEWEIDSFSKKYLKEITNAAEDSDKIILATDPDREGEAIAWHVKEVLDKKGVFVLEHADLLCIIKNNLFDTICHEHLEYYSSKVIIDMMNFNGLKVFDHELNDINGGSSRYFMCHQKANYNIKQKKIKTPGY